MLKPKYYREICSNKTVLPFAAYCLESKSLFFLLISIRRDRKNRAKKLSECHLQKKQAKKISLTIFSCRDLVEFFLCVVCFFAFFFFPVSF